MVRMVMIEPARSKKVFLPFKVFGQLGTGESVLELKHRLKIELDGWEINGATALNDPTQKSAMTALGRAAMGYKTAIMAYDAHVKEETEAGQVLIFGADPARRVHLRSRHEFKNLIEGYELLLGFTAEAFSASFQGHKMDAAAYGVITRYALPFIGNTSATEDIEEAEDREAKKSKALNVSHDFKVICPKRTLIVEVKIRSQSAIMEQSCDATISIGGTTVDGRSLKDPLLREAFTAVIASCVAARMEPSVGNDPDEQDVVGNNERALLVQAMAYGFLGLYQGNAFPKEALDDLSQIPESLLDKYGSLIVTVN